MKTGRPPKYEITEHSHNVIYDAYHSEFKPGCVLSVAKKLSLPAQVVSRYACSKGWAPVSISGTNWSQKECDILEINSHLRPDTIRRKLIESGYNRTASGVASKMKQMRLAKNTNGYTISSVSEGLGVDRKVISRAISLRKLRAIKRGTKRCGNQNGDIWHIRSADIRRYIISNVNEVDIRKADKHWLVDILTNGGK